MIKSPPFPILAYTETSLPVASTRERLDLALQENLALEVVHQGNFSAEIYQQSPVKIAAVQAYLMHEFHPLHRDRDHQLAAVTHVQETLELAARLGASRIVTVCGFGHELADRPFERVVDFFSSLTRTAKNLGIRIMIEPLSPKRCAALTDPQEIVQILHTLNEPKVFSLLLDTGHLLDSGIELNSFFKNWNYPVDELQLKGANSTPPEATILMQDWFASLANLPAVICVEHRQQIGRKNFNQLVRSLQEIIAL